MNEIGLELNGKHDETQRYMTSPVTHTIPSFNMVYLGQIGTLKTLPIPRSGSYSLTYIIRGLRGRPGGRDELFRRF